MIDLNRLLGFHLVASEGGYAKAARAAPYPITQPALHQQVKKLEAEVGVQLLERVAKDRMQPTAAGERLLSFVRPFLRDLPTVVRSLRTGDYDGTISIQAESLLIRQLLPSWLLNLRRRHPGAKIHLQELPVGSVEPLRTGAADVVVAHLTEIPPDIASEQVAEVHPFLVVPREGAPGRATARLLRDLQGETFLAYPAGSRHHALQLQALALHEVTPQRTIHLDTADLILAFVESGLGWSLVPSLSPKGPPSRRLTAYPLVRPRVRFPVFLAWRKDTPENPLLDSLLQCALPART
ncbi:MAG: LysR family transcriptional regulator [Planctomycetes bacterium]|nr:LysR family transcriptional regulator [Planctomycetota bacterium]